MISFQEFLNERASRVEVRPTPPDVAEVYFRAAIERMRIDFDKEFGNFKKNYIMVRDKISYARYKRNQMPVVDSANIDNFKRWLAVEHKVKMVKTKLKPVHMMPIQKELFLDNPLENIKKHGLKNALQFIRQKSHAITSMDHFIMDGNHRFLLGALHDPDIALQTYLVSMKAEELYHAMNYFTDKVIKKARRESVEC